MESFRVSGKGRTDRNDPVKFTFDGKEYKGFRGDTLASALLAHGVHLLGRSFKYHRPRGIVTAGFEEPNALVGTRRSAGRYEPNTRATIQEIYNGLGAESQNRFPSLKFDIGGINDTLSPFLSAGFYYKTFMWPRSFWDKVYEPFIRAAAGLGKAPTEIDPDNYASRYLHCDVLIVGSGPAGLAAALHAGRSGAKIVVVDEHNELGGYILSDPAMAIDGQVSWDWLQAALEELRGLENVKLMSRTTAFGYYHQNFVGLCQKVTDHLDKLPDNAPRERNWRVRAGRVVLAQGAIEKPLVFNGNDRPGIMLAGAAQTYLNRFGVKVGNNIAVVTSHDSAYFAAFDLATSGAKIVAIADTRSNISDVLLAKAKALKIEVLTGQTVCGTTGRLRIKSVKVAKLDNGAANSPRSLSCDTLLMSGGWTPNIHLFSHTKGSLKWDEQSQSFLPDHLTEDCCLCGASLGHWGVSFALESGALAGNRAASEMGFTTENIVFNVENDRVGSGESVLDLPSNISAQKTKSFVDFQNDVTSKDIRLAVREGMRSIEHVKRYTTNGMATDQGKLSNVNGLQIAADALDKEPPQVGLTTFRPPYSPTTFGMFAGYQRAAGFELTRKTPIHSWAAEQGAVFEPVSQWMRAWYFPKSGEGMHDAVKRECRETRKSLGIFDASTLGKIEVVGPDAVEFMNRMYTNPWTKLAPGRCRYGLLLGEDGFIRDDGVIGRLADDKFHVTTTTGGASRVLNMMEDYLQTEWTELQVWLTSTTEQWATIAINGPNARNLIEPFVNGLDVSNDLFPHMSVAECKFAGLPCRLFRLSFTGELGFELNVPARYGRMVWEELLEAGKKYDICPYGTETMHVLRAEKGYIIVGQDTDGTVTPDDAGLSWAIGKKKPDFVGKRSLARPDIVSPHRKQLVGLLTDDPNYVVEEGAQIVADPDQPTPMKMLGHVTSSYWSEALGRSIALALVLEGRDRMGETLFIPMPDGVIPVAVTDSIFYDPAGDRLNP